MSYKDPTAVFHLFGCISKDTFAGIFGAEVCAFGAPHQEDTFLGIVQFKHTHTRYPMTLLLALLVQRYVRSAHRTQKTLYNSTTNSDYKQAGEGRRSGPKGMIMDPAIVPKPRPIIYQWA